MKVATIFPARILRFPMMRSKPPTFISTPAGSLIPPRALPTRRHRRPFSTTRASATSSLKSISHSIRTGQQTATHALEQALSRLDATDTHIRSFLCVDAPQALERAAEIDRLIAAGNDPGPLAGVPVAIKDNICTSHIPTTAGSKILDGFVPAYDATVVKRVLDAGAIVLGKTNCDEFGMGSSTEHSAYGPTRNPWNVDYVPGGSSGGSAAAVAANICALSLGTDTGGSIRQPASFCGITGMKPSYGRVSRHGLLAYASSLDTIGPLCRSVEDIALAMGVISGEDGMDATAVADSVPDYTSLLGESLSGVRVGLVSEAMGDAVDPEVVKSVEIAVDVLKELGASVEMVSLPLLEYAPSAYYVIAPSEASANLARYDGVRYGVRSSSAQNSADMYARSRGEGFGTEVKRRVMIGTYALSSGYYDAYYVKAQRVRRLIAQDFKKLFEKVDILVSPVAPTPPFRIGEKANDPVSMFLDDIMTIPASLVGLPALSVPCGLTKAGLPVGMQIIAPFLQEGSAMKVGHAFQKATKHHELVPEMAETLVSAVL